MKKLKEQEQEEMKEEDNYAEIECKYCKQKKLICLDSYHTKRGTFVCKYVCDNCKKSQVIYAK